jgi:glycosyltransferase involved in cell wall biosynthesis
LNILIIHTFYQQKGGEDAVFLQEAKLLEETENIATLTFQNKKGPVSIIQFFISPFNLLAARKVKRKIASFKPDIIHLHNWHYAIGPIVIRLANKAGIPIVLTLHNYRLICPSATLMSDGKLFDNSRYVSFPWQAVKKKVYNNSFLQTFWLSLIVWLHKKAGTWKKVSHYFALTEFAKKIHLDSTLELTQDQISVKPNFSERPVLMSAEKRDTSFLFIGRFSEEKGIQTLLKAFSSTNHTLNIAGDGPLKEEVLAACSANPNIHYLGSLQKEDVLKQMRSSSALIFPSIWYEGMPMTILEAFSSGTPVIASNLGAMASLISDKINGLHFEAGNATDLKDKIEFWTTLTIEDKAVYSQNALASYERLYSPEKNKDLLLKKYKEIIAKNK